MGWFIGISMSNNMYIIRWTDGDVRTLAAAMFLKKDQLHFFNNIGYSQGPFSRCPLNANLIEKCSCDYKNSDGKMIGRERILYWVIKRDLPFLFFFV
jgi:alpha 1,2-mannosyltransferase